MKRNKQPQRMKQYIKQVSCVVERGQRPPESIDTGRPSEDLRQKRMLQITTEFQPVLGTMKTATILKGTPIKIGLVGAQPTWGIGLPWLQIKNIKPQKF